MVHYKSIFFKNKLSWVKSAIFSSFLIFICKANAGMVWETTNAPIVNGLINSGNYSGAGASGRLVGIGFNDQTQNPCYGRSCIITVGVFTNMNHFPAPYMKALAIVGWMTNYYPEISKVQTMGELYNILNKKVRDPIEVGFNTLGYGVHSYYCDPDNSPTFCLVKNRWEAYSKICYALVYTHSSSAYYNAFPGQSCIGPTPPNNECNIDAGAAILNHGQLGTDEVNGHKKKESVRLSCTYPANANISVVSNNASEKIELKADGSLFSTVTIDGVPGITGKKINIPTGGVLIDLESTLHTAGNVEEGPFSGNAILIINSY
ncbi:TPA: hypothetical protein JHK27_004118 [Serratia marcescens]|uniref:MrpH family fimbial adhesin n=1 Tax=Serratia marcescens TaxID=615 RepID=UPI0012FE1743|nr:hypothetical protein [Serratia marcescens]HAV2278482.1 hypothetical protein [Serratia marcescens]